MYVFPTDRKTCFIMKHVNRSVECMSQYRVAKLDEEPSDDDEREALARSATGAKRRLTVTPVCQKNALAQNWYRASNWVRMQRSSLLGASRLTETRRRFALGPTIAGASRLTDTRRRFALDRHFAGALRACPTLTQSLTYLQQCESVTVCVCGCVRACARPCVRVRVRAKALRPRHLTTRRSRCLRTTYARRTYSSGQCTDDVPTTYGRRADDVRAKYGRRTRDVRATYRTCDKRAGYAATRVTSHVRATYATTYAQRTVQ